MRIQILRCVYIIVEFWWFAPLHCQCQSDLNQFSQKTREGQQISRSHVVPCPRLCSVFSGVCAFHLDDTSPPPTPPTLFSVPDVVVRRCHTHAQTAAESSEWHVCAFSIWGNIPNNTQRIRMGCMGTSEKRHASASKMRALHKFMGLNCARALRDAIVWPHTPGYFRAHGVGAVLHKQFID